MLYLVATPIGNLEDITFRAIRTLKEVDLIVAEDTRHVRKLLDHYQIKTRVDSYHSYSDDRKLYKILNLLNEAKNIALVSDAGTPGISDPGYKLIIEAIAKNIQIVPIPGPCALITALIGSGLRMDEFVYFGFLPVKKGRQTMLGTLQNEKRTMIFYESPHRILKTLTDFMNTFGADREIVIARELTKIHEEFLRGSISQIFEHFQKNQARGEFVIVVAGI
ncbi:MAG: protein of unknown function UPF0011 [Candidatus Peregrinibacteria bacterium GW2011_GWF2_33_10]|nr:MAG: protein of unknown function UPF0011 [Candidatus Peregrinibacteria bacterium GW2011_GWF2_33_10]OGJ44013.1 MAG: 16S rRNA (cytidine(1402)-2'-O)-methyltransferase [Candidatus Peregrinibacteria bacterium RIFOXYA2_FULL_33_21]OGJ47176.1 MAG: 16S rRNA (cytidine(1402)-2'-O)-methyltransferase [Candidatus Peregrinibacteria bacterium RIFOXYA12_FULL_33_12]OGJ49910.1 MAG: 16S rRNA (cytidine(1402)-2'-O)-methyltransferase [Candidatus Peregrinibacteria bacterium RIFOXYB2_FULL_33_20]